MHGEKGVEYQGIALGGRMWLGSVVVLLRNVNLTSVGSCECAELGLRELAPSEQHDHVAEHTTQGFNAHGDVP